MTEGFLVRVGDQIWSDLVGETAAAMAAASIVFRRSNPAYSSELLRHTHQPFPTAGGEVCGGILD
ncbi:hypothetical protein F8388_004606 [Cannabis sativa]|uniref:cellulase n=1 Tax=Cannabis sativa TaxID=3483 RepID=A0A7J6GN87_CANSA|nr:hypothetical protein F8388_004606 [Cannabis sativa]